MKIMTGPMGIIQNGRSVKCNLNSRLSDQIADKRLFDFLAEAHGK